MARNSNGGSKRGSTQRMSSVLTFGLDLSLTATGVVVLGEEVVDHALFQTGVATETKYGLHGRMFLGTPEERVDWLVRRIVRCWKKHLPALVAIEGQSFASKGSSLTRLAELHGALKYHLGRLEVLYEIIPPTTLKNRATGSGRASKKEMITAAQLLWPECPRNDNIADAFHLARCAQQDYTAVVQNISG